MSDTWREEPMEAGLTVAPRHKRFVEIDNNGNRTGRIKHVYPGTTAADNDWSYIIAPYVYGGE